MSYSLEKQTVLGARELSNVLLQRGSSETFLFTKINILNIWWQGTELKEKLLYGLFLFHVAIKKVNFTSVPF